MLSQESGVEVNMTSSKVIYKLESVHIHQSHDHRIKQAYELSSLEVVINKMENRNTQEVAPQIFINIAIINRKKLFERTVINSRARQKKD